MKIQEKEFPEEKKKSLRLRPFEYLRVHQASVKDLVTLR